MKSPDGPTGTHAIPAMPSQRNDISPDGIAVGRLGDEVVPEATLVPAQGKIGGFQILFPTTLTPCPILPGCGQA